MVLDLAWLDLRKQEGSRKVGSLFGNNSFILNNELMFHYEEMEEEI